MQSEVIFQQIRNLIRGIEQKYQAVEITDGDC